MTFNQLNTSNIPESENQPIKIFYNLITGFDLKGSL